MPIEKIAKGFFLHNEKYAVDPGNCGSGATPGMLLLGRALYLVPRHGQLPEELSLLQQRDSFGRAFGVVHYVNGAFHDNVHFLARLPLPKYGGTLGKPLLKTCLVELFHLRGA